MFSFRRLGRHDLTRGLAAVVLLALGAGCTGGSDSTTDFGNNDPSVVVAIGDSITFGKHDRGLETCDHEYRNTVGFCPRLQALTGKTVGNEGECGETSYGGLDKIDSVLLRWRPGVVLIDYSPNDLPYGVNATIANLRGMITAARANKTVPVLGTLVPAVGDHAGWEPFIVALNARILVLCDVEGLSCADHYKAFVNDPGFQESPYALLDADGLHPNSAGYDLMAETWRRPLMRQY
jgi:lysophospholipase L1-like esterase